MRARLARKLASTIGMDDWVRVRLGRVGGALVASPLPRGAGVLTSLVRADGLLVVPADVEGHHAGEEVEIELLRSLTQIERTIVAIGSHDMILDLAASQLRARDPSVTLASGNVGSMGGLIALRDGLCHLAGSHLLDPDTGAYTLPYVDQVLAGREIAVVRLVHRQQGLLVAPGNPLGAARRRGSRRVPGCATSTASAAPARACCSTTSSRAPGSTRTRSSATRARSQPTWPWRPRSPPIAPTAGWACSPPRARSTSTSSRSPASRTTSCSSARRSSTRCSPRSGSCSRPPAFRSAVEDLGGYDTAEMGRRIR